MPASPQTDAARRRRRHLTVFVTLPALLIGTAGVGSAAGLGWLHHERTTCTATVVAAPARSSFVLNVLNASDTAGAAGPVYAELGKRGFKTGQLGNDTALRAVAPGGEVRYGRKGLDQALLVQQQVPGMTLVPLPDRADTSVDVVVGNTFKGLAPRPPRPPARPEQVLLNVYNTTYYDNLATTTMNEMTARGFRRGAVSADPQKTWVRDVAVIRYGENGDLAAKLVAEHVPGATLQQDGREDTSVDLLLGMKWHGLTPRDKVPPLPAPTPTAVPTITRPCES